MSKSLLKQRQEQFMALLLGGEDRISAHITQQGAVDSATRLGIYQNAYNMRFRETIETDHEILGVYLGDTLFDEMVPQYIAAQPSSNHSLRQYADALPEFLGANEPFREHPQIAELARLERLLLCAFDAKDTPLIGIDELKTRPAERWPDMQLRFHPSLQLYRSEWNAVVIWQAIKAQQTPPPPLQQINCWLLWRNEELLTEFRSASDVEYALIGAALEGSTFAQLCEQLLESHGEEEVSLLAVNYLGQWIEQGLVSQLV
jgi:hypothetical protein